MNIIKNLSLIPVTLLCMGQKAATPVQHESRKGPEFLPNVNEAGQVLADLNDWRAIVFVLVFVIVILVIRDFMMNREMRLERQEMRTLARGFADSATKVADAIAGMRNDLMILHGIKVQRELNTVTGRSNHNHSHSQLDEQR